MLRKRELAPSEKVPFLIGHDQAANLAEVEVADLISSLAENIDHAGSMWQQVNRVKRQALDSENVREITIADDLACGLEEAKNRFEHRSQTRVNTKHTVDWFKTELAKSQQCATFFVFGDEAQKATGSSQYEEMLSIKDGLHAQTNPRALPVAASKLFFDHFDTYKAALEADNVIFESLVHWMGSGKSRVIELLEWMESDDCDQTGEHKPLMEAISRMWYDPAGSCFIEQIFEYFADKPHLFQSSAISNLAEQANYEETAGSEVSWFRFLPHLLERAGVEMSDGAMLELLSGTDYERLPIPLQEYINQEHAAALTIARERYAKVLEPFVLPNRFLLFDVTPTGSLSPTPKGAGKKRRSGGRVTTRINATLEAVAKIEPEPQISDVVLIAGSPSGFITKSIHSDGESLAAVLLSSKMAQDYLRKYDNGDAISKHLFKMLESVVETPRGDGCSKMKAAKKISFSPAEGNVKDQPLWHISPRKRHFVDGLGPLAHDTRIYYVLLPNPDGTETLGLYRIANKAETGNFKYGPFPQS